MLYQPKNFDHLLGTLGFSDQLLKNHFTLYQGYVANTNKLADALRDMIQARKIGTPEYAEVKRRFGWEFDGMRLHELYFGNMRHANPEAEQARYGAGSAPIAESALMKKIIEDFGSYENWEKDFKGTGAMRGIGWAILYYEPEADRVFNVWVNEHDMGHLAGCKPLLVLDIFEHAYTLDYGIKKADYIEAFFKAIDWETAEKRL